MHAVSNGAQSIDVTGDEERAASISERLEAIGLSDREFEHRTGVDRKALRRAANGEPVRRSTYVAIETWLDRIEHELGMNVSGVQPIGDPSQDLVEFTIEGNFGVRAVVKGPIRDLDALQKAATDLIASMGEVKPTEET